MCQGSVILLVPSEISPLQPLERDPPISPHKKKLAVVKTENSSFRKEWRLQCEGPISKAMKPLSCAPYNRWVLQGGAPLHNRYN